jgi:hypothetical protein
MQSAARFGTAFAVLAALSLAAVGCGSADGYPIMRKEQRDSDRLPTSFTNGMDVSDLEKNSTRLSAELDGTRYYLILNDESGEPGVPCLAIDGPDPMIGCGGGGVVTVTPAGRSGHAVQLVPSPAVSGDGWTAISDNVRVRAAG